MMSLNKLKSVFKILCYFLLALFICCGLYSSLIEPKLINIKHINLYIPNYNEEHNGLKIAVLSDLHIGRLGINAKQLKKIVEKTNKQNPDLILLLGDYDSLGIYYSRIQPKTVSDILSSFKAKYGVISVMGNHDYDKLLPIKPIVENAGIKVLEDECIEININSKPLKIYGLRDFWHYDYNSKLINKDDNSKSIIVMSHNPDTFPLLPDSISVALSGHTHGGQLYLPFVGGFFCSSMYDQRFLKGYIVENNKHLYVTSGIGNIGPMRFGNIPEVAILTLYSQNTYPDKVIIDTPPRKGVSNFETIPLMFVAHVRKYYKPKLIKWFGYI